MQLWRSSKHFPNFLPTNKVNGRKLAIFLYCSSIEWYIKFSTELVVMGLGHLGRGHCGHSGRGHCGHSGRGHCGHSGRGHCGHSGRGHCGHSGRGHCSHSGRGHCGHSGRGHCGHSGRGHYGRGHFGRGHLGRVILVRWFKGYYIAKEIYYDLWTSYGVA